MRRTLTWLLLLALLLTGCGSGLSDNNVEFFYCQNQDALQFGTPDAVIASEVRSITNRSGGLTYLLAIYLQGPQDAQLRSPFPTGTALLSQAQEGDTLTVSLSGSFTQLKGLDLTLACACLAKTCAGLTDAQVFTIQAGNPESIHYISMTIGRDQLLLEDSTPLPAETNPE